MDDYVDFASVLQAFMRRACRRVPDLAGLTGISPNTLKNWSGGLVKRPRLATDVLKLAHALDLDTADTNRLLRAAAHPSLTQLQILAEQTADAALVRLLALWDHATITSNPLPAPSTLSACHQLRAPVADFVGRAAETSQLVSALRHGLAHGQGALISGVQGMGGIGKTELAYAIAHQLCDAFPDAQLMLNLRGSSAAPLTPQQTLQAVIHTLNPEARLPDDLLALKKYYRTLLHNQRVLILADDAAGVMQVQALIPPSGSAVLITSRQCFTLPGMTTLDLEQLSAQAASTLLRAICPRLNEAEAQALAQACAYLPLALRVSGGILRNDRALSVAAYLVQLRDACERLAQLRDPDNPQLDVAAVLTLSYTQLDAATQQVFRQLGVFVADFATEMAMVIVQTPANVAVEATLHLLLRRNLVLYDAANGRWRLHDLLRDLARGYLEAAGEAEAAWWRYAQAVVQVAQATHEQYLAGGEGELAALSRFDVERAHIDAGRLWAADHAGTPEGDRLLLDDMMATRHVARLRYDVRRECIPQYERAQTAAQRLGDRRCEGMAFYSLGDFYVELGEVERAIPYTEQALTVFREISDWLGEGIALYILGRTYRRLGEVERAISYTEQALTVFREIGDRGGEGITLYGLGYAYAELGEVERAIPYTEQALTVFREIGHRRMEGYALRNLGNAYTDLSQAGHAIESCEVSLTIARDLGEQRLEGYALSALARAQARHGDLAHATTVFEQALTIFHNVGDHYGEAECNWQFGLALVHQGERERAVPLLRASVAYEQDIGYAKAAEHTALLARLEAGEALPAALCLPTSQRAVGDDTEHSTNDNGLP